MIKNKIVVFPPESCVWNHSFPSAIFADNLRKLNFDVQYFLQKKSPPKHPANAGNKNPSYCEQCKKKKKINIEKL